jgi:hypothetical protein
MFMDRDDILNVVRGDQSAFAEGCPAASRSHKRRSAVLIQGKRRRHLFPRIEWRQFGICRH